MPDVASKGHGRQGLSRHNQAARRSWISNRRDVLAGWVRGFGLRGSWQVFGRADPQDSERRWGELHQLAFRDQGTPGKSGGPYCLGEGFGANTNDCADARRAEETDDGGCKESGG